jgi:hypothetical protein
LSGWEVFGWGLFGGFLAEFAAVSVHRRKDRRKWPAEFRLWTYWAVGAVWIVLGGVFAYLYSTSGGVTLNPLLAVNVGATAPLIAEQLARSLKPALDDAG